MAVGHAERLLPMIDGVMRRADMRFPDLERIAVSIGPGTFTGVRTGIAAARALSLASGKPVVGATSLALMMQGARTELGVQGRDQPIAIAVDARRGEVYFQLFDAGGAALTQPQLATYAAALAQLPQDNYILAGSGGPRLAELGEASATTIVPVLINLEPDAGILAGIAATLPVLDPVKPVYLRAPDAKPQSGKSLPRAPQ